MAGENRRSHRRRSADLRQVPDHRRVVCADRSQERIPSLGTDTVSPIAQTLQWQDYGDAVSAESAALWVANWEGPEVVTDPWLSCCGISIHYHPEFTEAQIRGMTPEKAVPIFVKNYWPDGASQIPDFISIPLMAFSVLEGPSQAVFALQRALVVKVDGHLGPQTISAATSTVNKRDEFLEEFFGQCFGRFSQSPRWILDGQGWVTRQLAASLAAKVWA